jgi:uncharacterized protein (TIGR02145 family)
MKKNYSWALFAAALMFLGTLQAFAVDYTISFTGTGKSNTVGSIEVQNLTQGTTTTVTGGDVLVLNVIVTGLNPLASVKDGLRISSTSVSGRSNVSFFTKQSGNTQINVYSMDGRKILSSSSNLQKGDNSFQLSLPTGAYVINVRGTTFSYSGKLISVGSSNSRPEIAFVGYVERKTSSPIKSSSATTAMEYHPGDILLYKGISGNYATIVTDVPTDSKTVNFNFIECKDASGNYYATVKIGGQIWMAENLKTTKYRTGADIPNITNPADWGNTALVTGAWCYRDNMDSNNVIIGKLYNWWAANDARNIAPEGWHMPTRGEYDTLGTFLGGKGIAAVKMKEPSTRFWLAMSDPPATNESGFSARCTGKCSPSGVFNDPNYAYFWTSTDTNATNGISAFMIGDEDVLNISGINHTYYPGKRGGLALRCIMDDNTVKSVSFHATWQTDIEEWDFTYDASGRVAQMVNLWAGALDKTLTYDYSEPNKLTLTKDDNSVYASYDLNASGYITKDDQGGGDYLGYEYDNAGFGITFNEFFGTNVKKREVFITDGNVSKIVKYNDAGDTTQIKEFTYLADNNMDGIFQANISDSDWKPYGNLYGRPCAKLIESFTYWNPTADPIVKRTATFAYTRDAKNRVTKIVKTTGADTEQWDYTY